MMYKPKIKKGGAFGPQGVAKIEVNPKDKNQIRYTLKARTWNRDTKSEDIEIMQGKVERENCPEKIRDLIRPGVWFISTSEDQSKIYSIRPVNGLFEVTVDKFSAQEDQPPTPRTYQGDKWSYQFFTVILRIIGGDEAGMTIPYLLHYNFDKEVEKIDDKDREVVAYSHAKSKYTGQLIDFLDVTGAWDRGPMPYRDNILPLLEKRILEKKKTFKILMENGNVKSLAKGNDDFSIEFAPDVEE